MCFSVRFSVCAAIRSYELTNRYNITSCSRVSCLRSRFIRITNIFVTLNGAQPDFALFFFSGFARILQYYSFLSRIFLVIHGWKCVTRVYTPGYWPLPQPMPHDTMPTWTHCWPSCTISGPPLSPWKPSIDSIDYSHITSFGCQPL